MVVPRTKNRTRETFSPEPVTELLRTFKTSMDKNMVVSSTKNRTRKNFLTKNFPEKKFLKKHRVINFQSWD